MERLTLKLVSSLTTRTLVKSTINYTPPLRRLLLLQTRLLHTAIPVAEGTKLRLSNSEERGERQFHALWLRHNCHCSDCLIHRGQKIVSRKSLARDLKISSATVEDGRVVLSWVSDGDSHTGFIPTSWLEENDYSMLLKQQKLAQPLVANKLPRLSFKEVTNSDEGLYQWLKNLNCYGVCVLYGGPPVVGALNKVSSRIAPMQRTIYGTKFDVLAVDSTDNVAYSPAGLPLHMDLPYYHSSPGIQLLHTVRFDECVEGGESILLDAYPVVGEMKQKYPKQFETLTKVPVTFQKIRYESGEEHPVEYMQYHRPHIVLNCNNKVVGIHWSTAHQGPLCIPEDQIEDYYDAYTLLADMFDESPLKLTHRLLPGETLTFNNLRMLHARTAFQLNGGQRHFEGCYVNIDEYKNKLMVLSKRLGSTEPVRHVLNECWAAS